MDTKIKVLIADDEVETCELLQMYLETKGYEVSTANSGKDAIASVKDNTPNVLLLDKRIPDMDGLDILRAIRQFNKTLKVIMVTGADLDAETKAAITELGVSEYLHKPVLPPELSKALVKVLA
jgi:DNA-binding response OmpR family regulator